MSVYPEFSDIIRTEPDEEGRLFEVHRSMRSILPLLVAFLISAIFVYSAIFYLESSGLGDTIPFVRRVSPRWLAIIPAAFLLEILRRKFDDLYAFSENRVEHFAGRLSLRYNVPSVSYIDIRSVRVRQSIWGRIFDYGNVELGTAAQADSELTLESVRDPESLANIIEQFRAYVEEREGREHSHD